MFSQVSKYYILAGYTFLIACKQQEALLFYMAYVHVCKNSHARKQRKAFKLVLDHM